MSRDSLKNVSRLISIANTEVSVADQFIKDLDRSIQISESKYDGLPSKTYKPSSMNCQRQSYYQIVGVKPDDGEVKPAMTAICWAGTDMHERIQNAVSEMEQNGIPCKWINVGDYVKEQNLTDIVVREQKGFETKLYNQKYNISFMCDGIIEYKGKYYILEIKNESSNKWYSRTDVDSKHHHQAICYSLSLHIEDVLFLYIDRDMQNKKAYKFHVTGKMKNEIIEYIEYVDGYVKIGIVPPKPETILKTTCTYCGYKNTCKKDH